jgi:hypothetical protein
MIGLLLFDFFLTPLKLAIKDFGVLKTAEAEFLGVIGTKS